MKRPLPWLLPVITGACLIGLWYAIKAVFKIESFVLPAPHEILEAGWKERATLIGAAAITSRGALAGFFTSVALGFALSMFLALSIRIKQAFYPYVLILQMTPVIILAPIFVLWLGQGLPAIVAVTFMICFFPVVANTTMGFISVDKNLRDLFLMCNATKAQELRYLRVPGAMPYFLTGVKIAGTLAPIGAISGDFLAGSSQNGVGGIGFMTITYFSQLKTAALFATGATACLLGFVFVFGVNALHWFLLHKWHDSVARKE